MHFFGEHTYSFYNAKNERVWCKFHFKTQQGIKNLTDEEAEKIAGMAPDQIRETGLHGPQTALLHTDASCQFTSDKLRSVYYR